MSTHIFIQDESFCSSRSAQRGHTPPGEPKGSSSGPLTARPAWACSEAPNIQGWPHTHPKDLKVSLLNHELASDRSHSHPPILRTAALLGLGDPGLNHKINRPTKSIPPIFLSTNFPNQAPSRCRRQEHSKTSSVGLTFKWEETGKEINALGDLGPGRWKAGCTQPRADGGKGTQLPQAPQQGGWACRGVGQRPGASGDIRPVRTQANSPGSLL